MEVLKRRREKAIWNDRVRKHVSSLLTTKETPIEVLISGTPQARVQLLDSYETAFGAAGFRLVELDRDREAWRVAFAPSRLEPLG